MMLHYLLKLENTIKDNWEKEALCNYNGEKFSYCELAENIARLHIFFQEAGLKKGDNIAICAKNSARWGIAFLASNTYETVTVPILADFMPDSIEHLVDHSESKILFTDPDIWKKLDPSTMPCLKAVISVSDFTMLFNSDERSLAAFESIQEKFTAKYPMGFARGNVSYPSDNYDQLAIINYTSGTTSAPKGVMLTYGNMSSTIDFSQQNVKAGSDDRLVSMLPMAHMYGLAIEFLFPCCSGATVYFLGKTPSPTLLMKAMQTIKPFMVVSVPLVFEKVYKNSIKPAISKWYMKILILIPGINNIIFKKIRVKLMGAFGGCVRLFIMGGAAVNPEVEKYFKKIGLPYTVGYGMTEACPLLSWEEPAKYVVGSCGKACHNVRIDSEDPVHIAGEIQAKGPNICLGYFKNDEATKMLFTDDGYMHTGDLGVLDKAGNIYIKGRSKSMILSSSGQNIYPEELEAIINSQDYVAESVVVDRASKIVALIYLDKDAIKRDKLDNEAISDIPETVRIASNRKLPSYCQITKVEVVTEPFQKTPKMSIKRFLYK